MGTSNLIIKIMWPYSLFGFVWIENGKMYKIRIHEETKTGTTNIEQTTERREKQRVQIWPCSRKSMP